jgi:hypothetical protein
MKAFYLSIFLLIGISVYFLLPDNSIIPQYINKVQYKSYVFNGKVDPDTIVLFKPSIVNDYDVIKYKKYGYYLNFDQRYHGDKTTTIESFLSANNKFLVLDVCVYDLDDYLISQDIKKYKNPSAHLINLYKKGTMIYDENISV